MSAEQHQCGRCGRLFETASARMDHINDAHSDALDRLFGGGANDRGRFECGVCGRPFGSVHRRADHVSDAHADVLDRFVSEWIGETSEEVSADA
jgi:transcription elongation factor Elf1